MQAARGLTVKSPQLGMAIGNYIKQLNLYAITEARKTGDTQRRDLAQDFIYLQESSLTNYVSSVAGKRQRLASMNVRQDLPLSTDINSFSQYLRQQIQNYQTLTELILSLTCLAFLVLFNRRQ